MCAGRGREGVAQLVWEEPEMGSAGCGAGVCGAGEAWQKKVYEVAEAVRCLPQAAQGVCGQRAAQGEGTPRCVAGVL